jgi:Zn-dependent peptidase ImmA (M78 family)
MTKVAVSEAVLSWAVERSGIPLTRLLRRFPKLEEWQRGDAQPTLRQLEDLARATAAPLGFLFLEEPPEEHLPVPHFRTVREPRPRRPSANLLDTVHSMQRRQQWMRDYLVEEGYEGPPFVGSAALTDEPADVAAKIRRALDLTEEWAAQSPTWMDALRRLRSTIEAAGILVVASGIVGNNTRRALDVGEFRGFVLVDKYAPLVFVNAADARAAQMFTLAHEVAHVWFGSSAAFDLRDLQPASDTTEQVCNRTAAEFLIPESALRDTWANAQRDAEPFQIIARRFKVSVLVAARRALDLRLIRHGEFLDFYRAYLGDERRTAARMQGGGDFYATQALRVGERFGRTVVRAAKEGKLLYRDAYHLTGLHGRTFDRFASGLDTPGRR